MVFDKFVICWEVFSEVFVEIVIFLEEMIILFWVLVMFIIIDLCCWIWGIFFDIFCLFNVVEVFWVFIEMFWVVIIVFEVVIVLGKVDVEIVVIMLVCWGIVWIVVGILVDIVFWRILVVEICLEVMICCWIDLFDKFLVEFVVILY